MATTIIDAAGLDAIRQNLSGDYILGDDIDLSSIANWEPVGTLNSPFTGTVDFNGYGVTGLAVDRPNADYIGLFGFCRFNDAAKIPNVVDARIEGEVTGRDYVGMLAGYVETTLGSTGEEQKDPAIGPIVLDASGTGTVTGRKVVGGLFGKVKGPRYAGHKIKTPQSQTVFGKWIARVESASCSVDVICTGEAVGGLVGEVDEIALWHTKTTGEVTGEKAGGLIGKSNRGAIYYAVTTGNVTAGKIAGGIVGYSSDRSQYIYCRTEGAITGTGGTYPGVTDVPSAGVGGIAGYLALDSMEGCCSYGDVTAKYRAGGLIGSCKGGSYTSPAIRYCYSRGDVTATMMQAGGLIGLHFAGREDTIYQCYCTGAVSGHHTGALIGVRGSFYDWEDYEEITGVSGTDIQGKVIYQTDCFYNSDVNTASNQYGGVAKTDAEMRLDVTYETSDEPWLLYDRYWVIDDEEGDYYPQLLCFYEPFGIALACVRGSQGLTLGYVNNGEVFYRQLTAGTWGVETKVENFADVNTINLFRTRDGRIGFLADEGGALEWALTEAETMTIDDVKSLQSGYYGDVVHTAEDEAYLFYIGEVGSMNQMKGDVSAGWDAVSFGLGDPLPSDSQITRLRVAIFGGDAYLVWRSRGQHRMAKLALAKAETELYRVREGSITMAIDNPIISLSLELDDQEVTV